jgi:hypothetical protein
MSRWQGGHFLIETFNRSMNPDAINRARFVLWDWTRGARPSVDKDGEALGLLSESVRPIVPD